MDGQLEREMATIRGGAGAPHFSPSAPSSSNSSQSLTFFPVGSFFPLSRRAIRSPGNLALIRSLQSRRGSRTHGLSDAKMSTAERETSLIGETTKKPRWEENENRERVLEGGSSSVLEDREEEEWEEEEGEEGDEEEGYRLQFDGEMDPLDFVQVDANGVELYQQFERLEYEALAERKRKALHGQQSRSGDSAKKPRQEEFLGVTMKEINEMMNFGSRSRSKL